MVCLPQTSDCPTLERERETDILAVSHNVTVLRIERWQHLAVSQQPRKGHGRTSEYHLILTMMTKHGVFPKNVNSTCRIPLKVFCIRTTVTS
jgi:hypothetical protein